MIPARSLLLRAAPLARNSLVSTQRGITSGPPAVRVSLAEKFAHMAVMSVSFLAIPLYVLSNVRRYRERA